MSQQHQQQQQTAEGEGWFVEITDQPLDLLRLTGLVTNPAAGAISTFVGTTRNNFDNKAVLHLEYEAYVPMAVAKLKVCLLATTTGCVPPACMWAWLCVQPAAALVLAAAAAAATHKHNLCSLSLYHVLLLHLWC